MPVPISLSLCPVLGDDGAPVGGGADRARHHRAAPRAGDPRLRSRRRVRESEAMANVGSWLWDLRTGAVQWSDEFHRIHGVDPLYFDGTLDAHLHSSTPTTGTRSAPRWRRRSESADAFERRVPRRPTRPRRPYRPRAWSTDGRVGWIVVGLRGIGQDVTDRRLADGLGISGEEMSRRGRRDRPPLLSPLLGVSTTDASSRNV